MDGATEQRAAIHRALGEPHRLAIIDQLGLSDRSPKELADALDLPTNLVAHHLELLEVVGLIERFVSAGDRRRRYVRLRHEPLLELGFASIRPTGTALFVCSHNSARSPLAAALWHRITGYPAASAGTEPAEQVHPGAVAAAARAGLDLSGATPRMLDRADTHGLVVTVCDRAHETIDVGSDWLHWSINDPVSIGSDEAFDAVIAALESRITTIDTVHTAAIRPR